jgi:hypothetical protein
MNGTFRAKATSGQLCETKEQKPQVGVELELLEDDHKGKRVGWFGQLSSDASFEFTVKALRAAGWTGDDLSAISFDGRECSIVIEEEQYDQDGVTKTSSKVKYINPIGGLQVKAPMSTDRAKAFAAQMKGKVLAHNARTGTTTSSANGAAPAVAKQLGQSDDIPF